MKRVAIIGGETHISEVTQLAGEEQQLVGAVDREDQRETAAATFQTAIFTDEAELYAQTNPEIVAVANENDQKARTVLQALAQGCDVVVDKPLALTLEEQEQIEAALRDLPKRRLLMLLTLRGQPLWAGMRAQVQADAMGAPAFCHVRMAVQLKRAARPPWFLDVRRAGLA